MPRKKKKPALPPQDIGSFPLGTLFYLSTIGETIPKTPPTDRCVIMELVNGYFGPGLKPLASDDLKVIKMFNEINKGTISLGGFYKKISKINYLHVLEPRNPQ